jgi:hypothetical protein
VAVCATDLALGDLGLEGLPRNSVPDQRAHVGAFVPKVIEVEKDRIRFTAVHAWVLDQELANAVSQFSSRVAVPHFGIRDVTFAVPRIPVIGVIALAREADPLSCLTFKRPVRKFG